MLAIGIIFFVAAATWAAVVLRKGGLIVGCLVVILCGSVFGHAFFHLSVVTLDRVLCGLLLGLYILHRLNGRIESRPLLISDGLFLLFLVLLTANTLTNDWKIDGAQPASRLLFLYLLPACIFWIARNSCVSVKQIRWILASCVGFGLYLSLTSVAESLWFDGRRLSPLHRVAGARRVPGARTGAIPQPCHQWHLHRHVPDLPVDALAGSKGCARPWPDRGRVRRDAGRRGRHINTLRLAGHGAGDLGHHLG